MKNYADFDEAATTLRFVRFDADFDGDTQPDATSFYDITPTPVRYVGHSPWRRRQIRDTRQNILRLREALTAGWDVASELAFEERQLATLEAFP